MLVTIVGLKHYEGKAKVGDYVKLYHDKDNAYDGEAIAVRKDGLAVGYVANSVDTVISGSSSAGRVYDEIIEGNRAKVVLAYVGKNHNGKGDFLIAEILDK